MKRTFALLGGDTRQTCLARLIAEDGHQVITWGVPDCDAGALKETAEAQCVLLPLPLSRERGMLNCTKETLALAQLWRVLTPSQLICAGQAGPEAIQGAKEQGLELEDYFLREELTVINAVATAEGALQLAMEHLPVTLWGTECIVIGYGRIGKLLARRLRGLGASVTVAARSYAARSWALADGMKAISTEDLTGKLRNPRLIFNTAPSLILNRGLLRQLPPKCLCIDLASRQGIDGAAAEELGIPFLWARGLPGKAAPETAAAAIRDAVYHILEERGETV
ncbi:dipicolinate synthase [Oscillibacter sp. MSJ-2]|uniref:Dipicolinate synthase n=1 Tax=Dysosmobacter acutus TaxID=2841504 RepID=A0ABS6FA27_9FIRM|nr:dipicolinate synthase subunit DpsA [Dysosmobacter acutus]MBU5626915.1 dipicolinate synthase [Dysosmobacter acutus]